jgi:hypothetical protein
MHHFDGGWLTSALGVLVLAEIEHWLTTADRLQVSSNCHGSRSVQASLIALS